LLDYSLFVVRYVRWQDIASCPHSRTNVYSSLYMEESMSRRRIS